MDPGRHGCIRLPGGNLCTDIYNVLLFQPLCQAFDMPRKAGHCADFYAQLV
jgi:hypothetical protein